MLYLPDIEVGILVALLGHWLYREVTDKLSGVFATGGVLFP